MMPVFLVILRNCPDVHEPWEYFDKFKILGVYTTEKLARKFYDIWVQTNVRGYKEGENTQDAVRRLFDDASGGYEWIEVHVARLNGGCVQHLY